MYKSKAVTLVAVLVLLAVLAAPASADVVVKQKTTSSMMGGMMTMNGTHSIYISGDMQRSDIEMKSEMPMFAAPAMKTEPSSA